jgi:hypothetical protein
MSPLLANPLFFCADQAESLADIKANSTEFEVLIASRTWNSVCYILSDRICAQELLGFDEGYLDGLQKFGSAAGVNLCRA